MKRKFIVAITAILLLSVQSPVFAHISGINLLSQSHHIRGGDIYSTYDITDNVPVEAASELTSAKAGNYSVMASAGGNDLTNIFGAYAASTYLFQIENNQLNVKLDGYIWFTIPNTYIEYCLIDTTTSTLLDKAGCSASTSYPQIECDFDYSISLTGLDTSHVYDLQLYARASDGDGGYAVLNAGISSTPVPAPSAIMLGALGSLITGWLKRRDFSMTN